MLVRADADRSFHGRKARKLLRKFQRNELCAAADRLFCRAVVLFPQHGTGGIYKRSALFQKSERLREEFPLHFDAFGEIILRKTHAAVRCGKTDDL